MKLRFENTSIACPEQYTVLYKNEITGYVRERHGFIRAVYLGTTVFEKTGDFGDFKDNAKRINLLSRIAKKLTKRYLIEKYGKIIGSILYPFTIVKFNKEEIINLFTNYKIKIPNSIKDDVSMSKNKFNKICFKIKPIIYLTSKNKDETKIPYIWEQVRPIIDGREILDKLGNEKEEDYHYGMETYDFLKLKDEFYYGKLLIGICLCSIKGCHDIIADVITSDNYVSWKVYDAKEPEKNEEFIFDKAEYEKTIEEAKSKVTQKEKFSMKERCEFYKNIIQKKP